MDTTPFDGAERSSFASAGDGLRSRTALVSGPTFLAGGHDGGHDTSAARVPDDAGLDDASTTGPRPDRWRGARGRTVSGRLCPSVDRVENLQRVLKWCGRDPSLTPKRMVERKDDAQQQAE